MAKIIAVVNQKGGVGKTSTAYNEAYILATQNNKVLLIDLEPSRNASEPFTQGVNFTYSICDVLLDKDFDPVKAIIQAETDGQKIDNLFILPSRIQLATTPKQLSAKINYLKALKKQIAKIDDQYDYIIMDCPPMLSELSNVGIAAATSMIIPLTYSSDALDGIADLFKTINEIKEDEEYEYKILRNAKDPRNKVMNDLIEEKLAPFMNKGVVFNTVIRRCEEINKAKGFNLPVLLYSPKCSAVEDYAALAEEIRQLKND